MIAKHLFPVIYRDVTKPAIIRIRHITRDLTEFQNV